jgi:PAS domain S-box-containing protein
VLPDGTVKHIHGLAHPVLSPNGALVEVVGTVVDISEHKHAEEALLRSESYLAQAQKLAHIGSWAWEVAERSALYLSEEWYRIYGFDPKDGVPTWEELLQRVHPEDQARWQAAIDRAIAKKSDYDVQFRIRNSGTPIRFIHSVGRPLLSPSGELLQFVGVAMDVTERKRAEEERQRLRQAETDLAHISRVHMLGHLTASLAHEINQPIGAAVANAEACLQFLDRDQPDVAEAREAAFEMAKDARRAAAIIERVRSLYRKSSSPQELVDVNEVIREMVLMLHNQASRYSVMMRAELAETLPNVIADRVQLQQVMMNLMLNGIEAMQDTTGELTIKSQLAEGEQLLISVIDTGVGLPVGKADQIFNAFFTTKSQGTGLGLAITRSILESLGGRVWATANPGRGATFQFTLPSTLAVAA